MTWNPGQPNVTMKRVVRKEDLRNPGDYYFVDGDSPFQNPILAPGNKRPTWMVYVDNRGSHGHVALFPHKQNNGASWQWDGNWEAPTLSPSIHSQYEMDGQTHTHWHGWIKGGVIGFEC